jgi:glycosyltransferase involved in cell wall biosynthesis
MNVVVVSGMWPPDVGGPASHAPELCEFLLARGHRVAAVTMADATPAGQAYPVHWSSRRLPVGARHAAAAARIARAARGADVVYSTGMLSRSMLGAAAARVPAVVKLTSDPVFERSMRRGLFAGDLAALQHAQGRRIELLRRLRDAALARAARIVVPSEALRDIVLAWGVPAEKLTVVRNPVSVPPDLGGREELRQRYAIDGTTLVYAGRLVPQKSLETALAGVSATPDVTLFLAGDGPERERLAWRATQLGLDSRVRFLGPLPRRTIFELLLAADASLLTSTWENFPHLVVESLAVGTPVLATDVGGVSEILEDGRNGLLVPSRDPVALGAAIRRYLDEPGLKARLRRNAAASLDGLDPAIVYMALEALLAAAARAW